MIHLAWHVFIKKNLEEKEFPQPTNSLIYVIYCPWHARTCDNKDGKTYMLISFVVYQMHLK